MTAIALHFFPSLLAPELRVAPELRYGGRTVEELKF
jgi:hypothetical protein